VSDAATIQGLRRYRRMYGGGMRQAGILAAAGIYALEHNVTRLKEDHEHARQLARILHKIPNVSVDLDGVETNIVMFDVMDATRSPHELLAALKHEGVLINAVAHPPGGPQTFRAVTHLDVGSRDIEEAGAIFMRVLSRTQTRGG
jgi:threonine aldolase